VLRRPRATLAAWAAVIGVLAVLGGAVEQRISPSSLSVAGTQSSQFDALYETQFGSSSSVPILLEGPRASIDAQGPGLVRALSGVPHARLLSPWSPSAPARLRPSETTALIALSIDLPSGDSLTRAVEQTQSIVDEQVRGEVHGYVTGEVPLASALKEASYDALRSRERLALIVLAFVLLLVLRSPIAAAIPIVAGAGAVAGGYGLIWLLTHVMRLDETAIALASMMGLALGVDYALLMVARFREELARRDGDAHAAAIAAAARSGRTVALAGAVLIAGMLAATATLAGGLLISAAVGVVLVALLSVMTTLVAVPPALVLLAPYVERWRIRGAPTRHRPTASVAPLLLRRPAVVTALVAIALLALAVPAAGLRTGAPDPRQLPASSDARQAYETVGRLVGPGYAAPFEVVVVAKTGAITEMSRLRALRRWQHKLSRDPAVILVAGPGDLAPDAARANRRMQGIGRAGAELSRSRAALARLGDRVGAAGARARGLEAGAARADSAARELAQGSISGVDGAGRVRSGLDSAADGVESLQARLRRARGGAGELATASSQPLDLVKKLEGSLGATVRQLQDLAPQARAGANDISAEDAQLESVVASTGDARAALAEVQSAVSSMSRWDPRANRARTAVKRAVDAVWNAGYKADKVQERVGGAAERARRVADTAAGASAGLASLRAGTKTLARALRQLQSGGAEVAETMARLAGGGDGVAAGLRALTANASELDRDLGALRTRASRVIDTMGAGQSGAGSLEANLAAVDGNVGAVSKQLRTKPGQASNPAASLSASPYFTLAALDRAKPGMRDQAAAAVNLDRGGIAGHILVVPRGAPNDPATRALADRLRASGARLGEKTGTRVAVGGPAAVLKDYGQATSERLWLLIATLAAVTLVLLAAVFRSMVVALVAVVLNLLTVAAAFGVMTLLFQGGSPLGGPGYLDAIAATAIFTVMFGLSTDYQLFLLTRMRERHAETGDSREAVLHALQRTAPVIGGAALIMTAVFVTFALSDVANVRQFGVGLAIAVLLDATVVRLVLLPAVMLLLGERSWGRRRRPARNMGAVAAAARATLPGG
jgi:RND superfamily putative drug exporter